MRAGDGHSGSLTSPLWFPKSRRAMTVGLKTRYYLFVLLSAIHLSPCWREVICVPRAEEAREYLQCQRHKPLAWRLPMPLRFLPRVPRDLEYDIELLSWKRH